MNRMQRALSKLPRLFRDTSRRWRVGKTWVSARVHPACSLYSDRLVELLAVNERTGETFTAQGEVLFDDATVKDFDSLCKSVKLDKCRKCRRVHFVKNP